MSYVVNKVAKMASECLSVCIIWTLLFISLLRFLNFMMIYIIYDYICCYGNLESFRANLFSDPFRELTDIFTPQTVRST